MLSVDYGQNRYELQALDELGIESARVHVTEFPRSVDASGTNLIPGRNAMFLSLAAAMLPDSGGRIYIGSNADDQADYPDCREAFFIAFEQMQAAQGREVKIKRPLINMTKRMVIAEAKRRGVPIEKTASCYINAGCGECNACKLRQEALRESR
jgi:7-cyano-7-deazaguanine synthase